MSVTSVWPDYLLLLASDYSSLWPIAVAIMALVLVVLPALIVILTAKLLQRSPLSELESDQYSNRDWLLMGIAIIGSGAIYSAGPDLWYHSLLTCAAIGFGFRCVLWGVPPLDKRRRWWVLTMLGSLALTQCITFLLIFTGRF